MARSLLVGQLLIFLVYVILGYTLPPPFNRFFWTGLKTNTGTEMINHFHFGLPAPVGPLNVGTIEVEIPVSSLVSNLNDGQGVHVEAGGKEGFVDTILFRVYYPADKPHTTAVSPWYGTIKDGFENLKGLLGPRKGSFSPAITRTVANPVYWIPEPFQNEILKGYLRFGGMQHEKLIESLSKWSSPLYRIKLPATNNAPLLTSTNYDWKLATMVFSHGLGGSRLAYSHLCSSMASNGVVVFCLEHRDGSGPVSFVRKPHVQGNHEKNGVVRKPHIQGNHEKDGVAEAPKFKYETVDYVPIPHTMTDDMADGRDYQLAVRGTELTLLYQAMKILNRGEYPKGALINPEGHTTDKDIGGDGDGLRMFEGRLNLEPGKVIWSGHSFGAATMVQFIKTVFYSNTSKDKFPASYVPLLSFDDGDKTGISGQITKKSPLLLLDLWSLTLMGSRRTHWLWKQPLPQVLPLAKEEQVGGGTSSKISEGEQTHSRVLAMMTEEFYIWKQNMWAVKWALSRNPGLRDGGIHEFFNVPAPDKNEMMKEVSTLKPDTEEGYREPLLFYSQKSAHFTQSDFGQVFSLFLANRAPDPRRVVEHNVRAAVQWLREAGYGNSLVHPRGPDGAGREENILTNAALEGEDTTGKDTIEGWVKLNLTEEPIKRREIKQAVEEAMSATAEWDVVGDDTPEKKLAEETGNHQGKQSQVTSDAAGSLKV